jgi:hypothetical protein
LQAVSPRHARTVLAHRHSRLQQLEHANTVEPGNQTLLEASLMASLMLAMKPFFETWLKKLR